mgnify:FL=1
MKEVSQQKKELVNEITQRIKNSRSVALVDTAGIRTRQIQDIRGKNRGKIALKVIKKTLLFKALDSMGDSNLAKLKENSGGQIALITSDLEPTEIYRIIESTFQKTAPRGGEIAPEDIVIQPMTTGFPPGPMMTEFQKVGLQTGVEKGKIAIKKETVFVKKGETISKDKAKILEMLEIKPLEVGLQLLGLYSEGLIYSKDVLALTPDKIAGDLASAFAQAKSLAKTSMFFVDEVLKDLLSEAKIKADALALAGQFITEDNVKDFLVRANANAIILNNVLNKGNTQETPEENKEEAKKEEKSPDESISEGLGALFQ